MEAIWTNPMRNPLAHAAKAITTQRVVYMIVVQSRGSEMVAYQSYAMAARRQHSVPPIPMKKKN